jgi:hypothetical protein
LAAFGHVGEPSDDVLPSADSRDTAEWDLLLECLADRILWDCDREMGDEFLDADPDASRAMMAELRIDPDYFTAVAPDPTDEELNAARRVLCEVAGRPVPGEGGRYRGFRDEYHDLLVGPCSPDDNAREAGCRLVAEIGTADVEGFDCSYGEWVASLRADAVRAGREDVTTPNLTSLLTPDQVAACGRAMEDGDPVLTGRRHRVERATSGWVICDHRGDVLVDVEWNCRSSDREDADVPPATSTTAADALAALVWAEQLAQTRAERREQAKRRLGRV